MSLTLCIDPGARAVGYATLRDGRVEQAGYFRFATHHALGIWARAFGADAVVVERPRVYPMQRQVGDQNDLISVALTAGASATAAPVIRYVVPRDWKGTRAKDVHTRLILRTLEARPEGGSVMGLLEQVAKTYRHNAVDAVGLAIWWDALSEREKGQHDDGTQEACE